MALVSVKATAISRTADLIDPDSLADAHPDKARIVGIKMMIRYALQFASTEEAVVMLDHDDVVALGRCAARLAGNACT
jgi:hypothetical protein